MLESTASRVPLLSWIQRLLAQFGVSSSNLQNYAGRYYQLQVGRRGTHSRSAGKACSSTEMHVAKANEARVPRHARCLLPQSHVPGMGPCHPVWVGTTNVLNR